MKGRFAREGEKKREARTPVSNHFPKLISKNSPCSLITLVGSLVRDGKFVSGLLLLPSFVSDCLFYNPLSAIFFICSCFDLVIRAMSRYFESLTA